MRYLLRSGGRSRRLASQSIGVWSVLRAHPGKILLWPAASIALVALLWSVLVWQLEQEHTVTQSKAYSDVNFLAQRYADKLARDLREIDQGLLNLKHYQERNLKGVDLQEQRRSGLFPPSLQLYATLIDRGGRVMSTTYEIAAPPNLAQRDYFVFHKATSSGKMRIDLPVSGEYSQRSLIRFSRRLEDKAGSFNGVAMISVAPEYFNLYRDDSSMPRGAFVGMWRLDGNMLAKQGSNQAQQVSSLQHPFAQLPIKEGMARLDGADFVDGQPRYVSWHALDTYPVVVMAGVPLQEAFSAYQAASDGYILLASIATAFLILAGLVGGYLACRVLVRSGKALEIQRAYRVATEGACEGFFMMTPVYDTAGNLADCVIEDCNKRGASFFGRSRLKMSGLRLSDLYPAQLMDAALGPFRLAVANGFHEQEHQVADGSPLKLECCIGKYIRSGDSVACTLRDISEAKATQNSLKKLALRDSLTGLPNRNWLREKMAELAVGAHGRGHTLCAVLIDIDDFKNVNDSLGHWAGDRVLQSLAVRMQALMTHDDVLVRLGGDEFVVVTSLVPAQSDGRAYAERVMSVFLDAIEITGHALLDIRASAGVSLIQDAGDVDLLLKHAEIAMYAAKSAGKNGIELFVPVQAERLLAQLGKERALRQAVDQGDFLLHFQPRVNMLNGSVLGFEALVRWQHPERGVVYPGEFIGDIERLGLIPALGFFVIRQVCAQLACWREAGLPVRPTSVNVSALQLGRGTLIPFVRDALRDYQLPAYLLELELTESALVDDCPSVNAELNELKELGITLLVDDFGTGYSSLAQLQRLRLDVLKIDRAFIMHLVKGNEDHGVLAAIISLARIMGMAVVAEGVETAEQARALLALGCTEVQGYLFSRPVPATDAGRMLLQRFRTFTPIDTEAPTGAPRPATSGWAEFSRSCFVDASKPVSD